MIIWWNQYLVYHIIIHSVDFPFVEKLRMFQNPYSSFWLPSELDAQAQWASGSSFDMPMGVLYAVLYAQSALGSLFFQPLPISLTVFCKMFFICLYEVSVWPLVWGWYGVAMLCLAPSYLRKALNVLSMKWDPPSLITILGVPKRGKITSWNMFLACLASVAQQGSASTHFDALSTTMRM